MSVRSLSEMDSQSLSALATTMAAQNPCAGRHVTVTSGKHKGRSGRVLKQIKDAYSNDKYSANNANNILSGVIKRNGYVSLVKFDDGTQAWIKSNYLEVVQLYQAVNGDRCETRGAKVEAIAKFYQMMAILFIDNFEEAGTYALYLMSLQAYNFVKMWFPTRQIIINGMHCGSVLECGIKPVSKPKLKQCA